jgi:hypothetical protein
MDGYLHVSGGQQDGGEWDDGRFRLAGDEESGLNVGRTIIDRQ